MVKYLHVRHWSKLRLIRSHPSEPYACEPLPCVQSTRPPPAIRGSKVQEVVKRFRQIAALTSCGGIGSVGRSWVLDSQVTGRGDACSGNAPVPKECSITVLRPVYRLPQTRQNSTSREYSGSSGELPPSEPLPFRRAGSPHRSVEPKCGLVEAFERVDPARTGFGGGSSAASCFSTRRIDIDRDQPLNGVLRPRRSVRIERNER